MTRIEIGLIVMLLLTACGGGESSEVAATAAPTRTPVPTYTPTPEPTEPAIEASSTEPALPPAVEEVAPAAAAIVLATATPTPERPTIATPEDGEPILTVAEDAVNVRGGPGTDYPLVGLAVRTAAYPITGRSAAGDWWQICCIDGQPGWLFGDLVTVANADTVAIAKLPAAPTAPAPPGVAEPLPAPTAPAAVALVAAEPLPATSAVVDPPQDSGGTAGNFDPNAQYSSTTGFWGSTTTTGVSSTRAASS